MTRKFVALDPDDLAAVLDHCRWVVVDPRQQAGARLRADLARAFTDDDLYNDLSAHEGIWKALKARLAPPVEHKVTMVDDCVECLACGVIGNVEIMDEDGRFDPFEPARLAQAHLDEMGGQS